MNIALIIFFGLYKALSILGFIYLVCNNHPYMAILLILVSAGGSLSFENNNR